jgi:hypothetical protein
MFEPIRSPSHVIKNGCRNSHGRILSSTEEVSSPTLTLPRRERELIHDGLDVAI